PAWWSRQAPDVWKPSPCSRNDLEHVERGAQRPSGPQRRYRRCDRQERLDPHFAAGWLLFHSAKLPHLVQCLLREGFDLPKKRPVVKIRHRSCAPTPWLCLLRIHIASSDATCC